MEQPRRTEKDVAAVTTAPFVGQVAVKRYGGVHVVSQRNCALAVPKLSSSTLGLENDP
ncbi:MAG: hypothetical protein GQE15_07195 [Archangiaceae bacterium]|nr:hypothetical protein [Archangiaceae bacterium]